MAFQILRKFANNNKIFELDRFKPVLLTFTCGAVRGRRSIDPVPGYPNKDPNYIKTSA